MPEEKTAESSGNLLFNLNTVLGLVTIVGGLILVSHRLSSERPTRPSLEGTRPLGPQNIESRLWEDPFAAWDKLKQTQKLECVEAGLEVLVKVLTNQTHSSEKQLVLGVMVSGQPYAEDKETRVRARYAVGAALGTGGYKPETAEHIGLAACLWPNTEELVRWRADVNPTMDIVSTNATVVSTNTTAQNRNHLLTGDTNLHLRVPFEQYERREFFIRNEYGAKDPGKLYGSALLLWLDEEYFEDDPATRLALFLRQISGQLSTETSSNVDWVIIGPRYSSTLRTLVSKADQAHTNEPMRDHITQTLKPVRLILATPAAMDEVLTTNQAPSVDYEEPRSAIFSVLTNHSLFGTVANYACTDKQLARAALAELKSRGIDPVNNAGDHVALVSEWDNFASRVSGLALAAEISAQCKGTSNRTKAPSFMSKIRDGTNYWPQNLHRFVYLQGLDGEAADETNTKNQSSKEKDNSRQRPTTIEELLSYTPDVNKAEGSPQFDYVARLGGTLKELEQDLRREHRGSRVAAVGIFGSDVYDTLVILQALRPKLPDAVFFTTDLDARFWDPSELDWSRNLVVLSSYGLRLTNELQNGVAPFRDSGQCAHYLATLDALGDSRVRSLRRIEPRSFEIGRKGPVELSFVAAYPHPAPRNAAWSWYPAVIAVAILAASSLLFWKHLRHLAFFSTEYLSKPLAIDAEDLGGEEGAEIIIKKLEERRDRGDPLAAWLLLPLAPSRERERTDSRQNHLIRRFNTLIVFDKPEILPEKSAIETTALLCSPSKLTMTDSFGRFARKWRKRRLRLTDRRANRAAIDEILESLNDWKSPSGKTALSAHHISLQTYERRRRLPGLFWSTSILLCGLFLLGVYLAWQDTFYKPNGEPFNFSGTSAWPAEFIRFSVAALSLLVVFKTQRRLSQTMLDITRRYRLDLDAPGTRAKTWLLFWPDSPATDPEVEANQLWSDYRQTRHWWPRLLRVLLCVGLYFCFAFALSRLAGQPYSPIRGDILRHIDFPLLLVAVMAFLFVTFWTIDAAQQCSTFITRLSQAPTRYPEATVSHFAKQRSIADDSLVEEWIDLQIVADLTEPIGRLVYWPFLAVLLMLVARNPLWDNWTWHWPLLVIFAMNLLLASTSSIILHLAAKRAREIGLEHLKKKVNAKRRQAAASDVEHESDQGERLLEEIKEIHRGAFVPWSKNPLVGALLVNSSGVVVLQLLARLFSH